MTTGAQSDQLVGGVRAGAAVVDGKLVGARADLALAAVAFQDEFTAAGKAAAGVGLAPVAGAAESGEGGGSAAAGTEEAGLAGLRGHI